VSKVLSAPSPKSLNISCFCSKHASSCPCLHSNLGRLARCPSIQPHFISTFVIYISVWPFLSTHCKGKGLLLNMTILNVSHTRTHSHTQSVGFLCMRDQPVAESCSWQHIILNKRQTAITPVGFEPAIPASDRLQTHVLNRAATGVGLFLYTLLIFVCTRPINCKCYCSVSIESIRI
jgi:hypothetical protein